jgi:hypothetical protein
MAEIKYKTCKVVLMDSVDTDFIAQHKHTKKLDTSTGEEKLFGIYDYKSLYVMAEGIELGDLFFHGGLLKRAYDEEMVELGNGLKCLKIVATTDTEQKLGLPGVPRDFLYDYIREFNANRPITEIQVELESKGDWYPKRSSGYGGDECRNCMTWVHADNLKKCGCGFKVKTDKDNQITIKPLVLYTREDLKRKIEEMILLEREHRECALHFVDAEDLQGWIEENLD